MRKTWFWAAVCLVAAGCKGTTTPSSDASTKQSVAQEQSATSYNAGGGNAITPTANVEATLGSIPDNLKTEGFAYFGLDNLKPQSMKVVTDGKQVEEGGRERKLLKVTPQAALFQQDYIGNLTKYGSAQFEARPDGIYTTSASGTTLPKPELELPAAPTQGKRWQVEGTTKIDGKDYNESGSALVVGIQKLKIGNKVYDALLVDETSTVKWGPNNWDATAHFWYVKGMGQVKSEYTFKGEKGTTNLVMQVTE